MCDKEIYLYDNFLYPLQKSQSDLTNVYELQREDKFVKVPFVNLEFYIRSLNFL